MPLSGALEQFHRDRELRREFFFRIFSKFFRIFFWIFSAFLGIIFYPCLGFLLLRYVFPGKPFFSGTYTLPCLPNEVGFGIISISGEQLLSSGAHWLTVFPLCTVFLSVFQLKKRKTFFSSVRMRAIAMSDFWELLLVEPSQCIKFNL